ncbi:metacaspase-2 isoform X1 [Papilio machaon]|uniref:metacaspase-2 isoform X1 n=1 Tax=Papilio machaon TaxID=76193 RepID=UPI001E662C3E|nr:metacaspase-2 isoform X1 [Papilio machaon]
MDDIYTNLENYDDFNKLEELQNENKTLKFKIEEYTSAINKLQKNILQDFDMLAVEHKKLELNYSSLLKTAKAEIERKTLMIKELNLEKDKLIINARQNNIKSKFNRFQNDRFNSKSNKSSDTSSIQDQPQTHANSQVVLNEFKNNNSSPLDTTSTCSGDTRDLSDALRLSNKSIKNDTTCLTKENSVQMSNKLPNKETETKVKKIMNRRKSMPVSSCRVVNYSTDDERESSVTTKSNNTQHQTQDERKLSTDRYYQNYKTYDTSSFENKYAQQQEHISSRNKSYYYNDSYYRNRDSYDSSQRRRWNISPDRSNRSGRDYADYYYQTYKRRGYDSPPRDKSYHQSRSSDRKYNYQRSRSRDYSRSNNDNERYAEKHKLQDEIEESSFKRQKYDHSYRYSEDEGRQRDTSSSKSAFPMLLENSVSCQSPDYVHPDSHTSVAPIREIRSTAVMHLEDPRLSSKKYKIITDCNKEVLTTVNERNVEITPVNKKLWDFNPIPIPKALIEPPSSYIDNMTKSFNMDYYSSLNMFGGSNEISNRTNGDYYSRNEPADITQSNNSKDAITNSTASKYKENQSKEESKSNQATIESHSGKDKTDVTSKNIKSGYKIPKKQNNSEVSISTDNVSNNKISNQDSIEKCSVPGQEMPQPVESISKHINDVKSNNNRDKQKDESKEKRLTDNENAEKFIEHRNHELAISRKIVESDLTLSDDTSDNFEPPLTIIDTQIKSKCKKYKTKERSKHHKGTIDTKKSENLPHANNADGKEKHPSAQEKTKHKDEGLEHSKKQKYKKKPQEDKDDVDDSKTSKIKKAKKEKEAKTEIKTKFSELFGDSSSLITCDDLGVVPRQPEQPNFSTIIEDTQDAVDINIKEIEQLQAAKPQNDKIEAMEEQANKQTEPSNIIDSDNKKCDLKINIRKTEDKYTIVNEVTEPVNMFSNNTNVAVSNIPETIIISTGKQQNNDVEFRQPTNVTCVERLQSHLSLGLALATSTPAKTHDQLQKDTAIQSDCSSVSSSDAITVKPQMKTQTSDTECQESDVPDVRIFVKRRRKAKK